MLKALRPVLVLTGVFILVGFVILAYQAIRTLQELTAVEAERDSWQQPDAIIGALNVKAGSTVVDLGSGSGYFTLKLAGKVGPDGSVIAVDLREISLAFLRMRAILKRMHNIQVIVGETDDPHLSIASVDSILIANTYHEFSNPQSILRHAKQAMRPGGRLVIVDRVPSTEHFHASPESTEAELRGIGFDIIRREDAFLHPAGDEPWWLIVAGPPTR